MTKVNLSNINICVTDQEISGDFVNLRCINDFNRAYMLEEGDVFSINNISFIFTQGLFQKAVFKGYQIDPFINPIWTGYGKFYDIEEMNEIVKGNLR